MARKKSEKVVTGTLLLEQADFEPPQPLQPPVVLPKTNADPEHGASRIPIRSAELPAGPISPPGSNNPSVSDVILAIADLTVSEGFWSFSLMVLADGGEVLDTREGKGVVTADGVAHSGWILAAIEAMRAMRDLNIKVTGELRIPDHRPVGFMRVTLPDRARCAEWDETIRQLPWPPIYQEFLDLVAVTGAKALWAI